MSFLFSSRIFRFANDFSLLSAAGLRSIYVLLADLRHERITHVTADYFLHIDVVLTYDCYFQRLQGVRLNYATTHHHRPRPTATHHQPKYIHHHPPLPTTSQNISTNTHHDPPTAKTFFIRNPFIRISSHCLTAT